MKTIKKILIALGMATVMFITPLIGLLFVGYLAGNADPQTSIVAISYTGMLFVFLLGSAWSKALSVLDERY